MILDFLWCLELHGLVLHGGVDGLEPDQLLHSLIIFKYFGKLWLLTGYLKGLLGDVKVKEFIDGVKLLL